MTDTPRTISFYNSMLDAETPSQINLDWRFFAQDLERELAEAREALQMIAQYPHKVELIPRWADEGLNAARREKP